MKKTKAQKIESSGKRPKPASKYALKIAERRKKAAALGLPKDSPYPLIRLNE